MEIKVIDGTRNPFETMYIAAKTCYSDNSPIDMEIGLDYKEFVSKVLKNGHLSIAEHVNFTLAIEGISRVCAQQLTRHRLATYSMQSQRYINFSDCDFVVPDGLDKEDYEIIGKALAECKGAYQKLVDLGVKKEDARCILPNCTTCNLVMTVNLRQLMHIANLRLCTRAQKEIRELFKEIKEAINVYGGKTLSDLLQPQCEVLGYCPEYRCCGRKKQKEKKENYGDYPKMLAKYKKDNDLSYLSLALDVGLSETTIRFFVTGKKVNKKSFEMIKEYIERTV